MAIRACPRDKEVGTAGNSTTAAWPNSDNNNGKDLEKAEDKAKEMKCSFQIMLDNRWTCLLLSSVYSVVLTHRR